MTDLATELRREFNATAIPTSADTRTGGRRVISRSPVSVFLPGKPARTLAYTVTVVERKPR